MKKHNFNAGPSILADEVIENAAKALLDFNGSGLTLLSISHRTKDFDDELAEVEEQADKRNILVTTRDVAGDVQVQASKSLMDLAIGNLLRNAIMHNISSGTLDIAARQEHCAIIVTITNSTDETLPDDLMNLKQPFHRGEHSRISAEPGVGLGLSIADAACEAMGATLELDRPDEQSFRATITLASA